MSNSMSGTYDNAPLLHVVATIVFESLPPFTEHQKTLFTQALFKLRYSVRHEALVGKLLIGHTPSANIETPIPVEKQERRGFFNSERTEAVIIDEASLEFRTSEYRDYADFSKKLQIVLAALIDVDEMFNLTKVKEVTFNYANLIIPYNDRVLGDYFCADQQVLPLTWVEKHVTSDLYQGGVIQFSRIVKPRERIFVSLEQLPFQDKKVIKYLPESITETSKEFEMPLLPQSSDQISDYPFYGIFLIQASGLFSKLLPDFDVKSEARQLHELVSSTFSDLINDEVCNKDWKYKEKVKDSTNA